MDEVNRNNKQTAVIYIHGRINLMPKGKKILTEKDAQPLIDMVKRELPMFDFIDAYVDGNTKDNKDCIFGCNSWNALIQECGNKKIDYVIVPSLDSLPFGASEARLLLRMLENEFSSTKVYFLLENICTADLNFVSAVSFELTVKDWVHERKIKKNRLIKKIII